MSRRSAPRSIGDAVRVVREQTEPATPLAAVLGAWDGAVGERIAARARPVREREGVVTVSCDAATWAQELDLLQDELRGRLNDALADTQVERLRFVVGDERD